jgi:hypothetical protein
VIQAQSREAPLIGCEGNHFYVYLTAGPLAGTGNDPVVAEAQRAEDGNGSWQAESTNHCSPVPKASLSRNRLDDGEFGLSWDDLIESKARVGQ